MCGCDNHSCVISFSISSYRALLMLSSIVYFSVSSFLFYVWPEFDIFCFSTNPAVSVIAQLAPIQMLCAIQCLALKSNTDVLCRPMYVHNRPNSRCQSLPSSLVFLNRASYRRWRNNDVTSQEREVTMMLRQALRTDTQICLAGLAFCSSWMWRE